MPSKALVVSEDPNSVQELIKALPAKGRIRDTIAFIGGAFAPAGVVGALVAIAGLGPTATGLAFWFTYILMLRQGMKLVVNGAANRQVLVTNAARERRLADARKIVADAPRYLRINAFARGYQLVANATLLSAEGRWSDSLAIFRHLRTGKLFEWLNKNLPATWVQNASTHARIAVFAGELDEAKAVLDELRAVGTGDKRLWLAMAEIPYLVRTGDAKAAQATFEREQEMLRFATSYATFLQMSFLLAFAQREHAQGFRSAQSAEAMAVSDAAARGEFNMLCTEWPELAEYLEHRRTSR